MAQGDFYRARNWWLMMEWETRIVPFVIDGYKIEMLFTTAALLMVEEKYGGLTHLAEAMDAKELSSTIWLAATLANQGAMLRNGVTSHQGAGVANGFITEEWIIQHLPPYELQALTAASVLAFNKGMRAEPDEVDEGAEVDVVLQEIESEKNSQGAE